jgi:TRAP-type mannitol/chloroaromatic compound transport system substrate-binding protein
MQRRKFLKGAGLVAASAGLAAPVIAQTPTVKWRMATSWPKSLDTLYGSAAAMCERIAQITDGKFQVQVFAGGEIVPPLQVFDAAANNTVECCHTLTSYFIGKNTAYAFDGGLPFGLNARQQASWLYYGGGMELLRNLFGKAGLVPVPVGNVGVQMGGWFRKEINSVDDLKGLKFRIGGLGGMVFSKLGVIPQQIAATDIYSALERGTIDAAEWIGPHDDEKFGFFKVAKYYYTPGWWEGSAQITSLVNKGAWEGLPKEFRIAYETAANEQMTMMLANYDAKNPAALRRLIASGTEIRAFPAEVMNACFKASQETFDELSSKNPDFKAIYEPWTKFANDSNAWFRLAEYRLDSARFVAPSR